MSIYMSEFIPQNLSEQEIEELLVGLDQDPSLSSLIMQSLERDYNANDGTNDESDLGSKWDYNDDASCGKDGLHCPKLGHRSSEQGLQSPQKVPPKYLVKQDQLLKQDDFLVIDEVSAEMVEELHQNISSTRPSRMPN